MLPAFDLAVLHLLAFRYTSFYFVFRHFLICGLLELTLVPRIESRYSLCLVSSSHRWSFRSTLASTEQSSRYSWLIQNLPTSRARAQGSVDQSPYLPMLQRPVLDITPGHFIPPLAWHASNDRMHVALHRRHPFIQLISLPTQWRGLPASGLLLTC